MDEHSGIQKPGMNTAHLYFKFANGQVEAQVVSVADRIEKAVELAKAACDEWLSTGYGEDDIPQIAHVGAITVTKKRAVAEDQEAVPVGVPADSEERVPRGLLALLKIMPAEDLATISEIVLYELRRRSGSQYRDTATAESLEVSDKITGAIGTSSAATFGNTIADN